MSSTGARERQGNDGRGAAGVLPWVALGDQHDFQGGTGKQRAADGHATIDEQGEESRGVGE